ncbi:AraC family transcriptional regulator [Luteolibacter ambystomatis]|uniref:AraC family transcriptional regulator n=1 Tax=Luteolibacter ambystomatis TaxID=2824561 RepID=A0A975J2D0_9BACT|nr:AraC family transcriptional regulator [Luteolibacter ambystomatis]QUE52701.1 AraC family transcriptional regulator [Luteolibacter ambystomatis]
MKTVNPKQDFLRELAPGELQSLYDLMPDISFFMKDTKGRFVALNRMGCEFCGVASERDAFGCTDRDFFPRSNADEYMADDRAVMESGMPILNRIEPAPENKGSPRLVVTNKIPVRDRSGRIIGVAGFSRRVEHLRCADTVIKKLAAAVDLLHCHHAEPLTISDLAKRAGLSGSQFERLFRKAFATSPRQYLLCIRVESACRLLVETGETVASIAQQCGFYDHAHFTKAFVKEKGVTPSRFRKEHQASPGHAGKGRKS